MGAETRSADGRTPAAGRGEALLHLLALTTAAIAQPLLDTLGRFAEFLVAHQLTAGEIVALTGALVLVPPLALWIMVILAGSISRRLGWGLYLALAGVLIGLWVLHGMRATDAGAALALPAALVGGGLGAWLLARRQAVRTFLAVASLAAVLGPLHFLAWSPASKLVRGAAPAAVPAAPDGHHDRTPLVLVVFDELPLGSLLAPDGALDATRFPNFARLAEDAVFYTRATSVAPGTAYAVPAILTGRYPRHQTLPTALDYPQNLFTLLGGSYRIHAHETLTRLCPQSLCPEPQGSFAVRARALASDLRILFLHLVVPPDLAGDLPPVSGTWRDFAARWNHLEENRGVGAVERSARLDIAGLVERYLEGIGPDRGVLHYLHLELPHLPWRYLPSGREYGPVNRPSFALGVDQDAAWRDDDWLITLALQRHLAQTMYADRVLGQLLTALERQGLYDRALLAVTADHGLAFQAGEPGRDLTVANAAEVASVPLFLRAPGGDRGRRSDDPVETLDILPTLAAAAGIALPWSVDGRSLLDPSYRGRPRRLITAPNRGFQVVLAPDDVTAALERAAQRIATAFPEPGGAGLFRIGAHRELLDRPLAELPQRAGDGYKAAIAQPWLYSAVDPTSGFLPARVDGELRAGREISAQRPVAVVVNGTVRAVTRSYPQRGVERFSALIAESAFVAGENRVEVFIVERDATGSAVLVPAVDRSGPSYRLEHDNGALRGIAATNGTGCTLAEAAAVGAAERDGLSFRGWAVDPTGVAPTVVVMVFVDDTLVWAGPTGAPPPPTAPTDSHPGLATAGFEFGLTQALLPRGDASRVRLFAVVGERCSELSVESRTES